MKFKTINPTTEEVIDEYKTTPRDKIFLLNISYFQFTLTSSVLSYGFISNES